MRALLIVALTINFCSSIFSQDKPIFLPEDIESSTLEVTCLCKPGVPNKSRSRGLEISFLHNAKTSLGEEDGFPLTKPLSELTLQQLTLKLRFPVINREGFKFLVGALYRPEHYDFSRVGADYESTFRYLDNRNLHSSGFEGLLSKSWNEKFYSSFRIRLLYNGDYSGIINMNSRYAIYTISGIFGIKKQANKEWGVGLNFSHSFRRTIALPFILYNHTFNDKWGLETVLPAMIVGRYNASEASILLLGLRYNSRSYSIETEDDLNPQIFNLNHSEARAALTLEQRVHPWVWLEITTGLQYNFSTDFIAKDNAEASFQVEPGTAPYFRIGIFISPPNTFFK